MDAFVVLIETLALAGVAVGLASLFLLFLLFMLMGAVVLAWKGRPPTSRAAPLRMGQPTND